ncbi:MAG: PqiC family protein [Ferrovibrionaceae bacterium]|jgi:uncharacterized lipoprotein YmbA
MIVLRLVLALALAVAAAACSTTPPPRLYVLTAAAVPSGPQPRGPSIGVAAAAVPEYLDRAEIVSRTRTNEILLSPDSRWAEGLAVNAQRVVTENLSRLLASDRVVMLPTRTGARVEIEVFVELMACEIDAEGRAVLAGRWSVVDGDSKRELAGARFALTEATGAPAGQPNYPAAAAALSKAFAAVSADIAQALARVPAKS